MTRKLYRSYVDKKIGGVCGGLAEYFDIDPVLIRALFIITTISYGIGFIAYITLWIIVPEKPKPIFSHQENINIQVEEQITVENSSYNNRKIYFGVILIVLGALLFINEFISIWDNDIFFSIILIVIGFILLFSINKKNQDEKI